jgi:hypothetical protein
MTVPAAVYDLMLGRVRLVSAALNVSHLGADLGVHWTAADVNCSSNGDGARDKFFRECSGATYRSWIVCRLESIESTVASNPLQEVRVLLCIYVFANGCRRRPVVSLCGSAAGVIFTPNRGTSSLNMCEHCDI